LQAKPSYFTGEGDSNGDNSNAIAAYILSIEYLLPRNKFGQNDYYEAMDTQQGIDDNCDSVISNSEANPCPEDVNNDGVINGCRLARSFGFIWMYRKLRTR